MKNFISMTKQTDEHKVILTEKFIQNFIKQSIKGGNVGAYVSFKPNLKRKNLFLSFSQK